MKIAVITTLGILAVLSGCSSEQTQTGPTHKICSFCKDTRQISCTRCGASGKVTCAVCAGVSDWAVCTECNGSGISVDGKCNMCGGYGRIKAEANKSSCPTCGGSGKVDCPDCKGSGKVACPKCGQ